MLNWRWCEGGTGLGFLGSRRRCNVRLSEDMSKLCDSVGRLHVLHVSLQRNALDEGHPPYVLVVHHCFSEKPSIRLIM
jgi:hypothetical protein